MAASKKRNINPCLGCPRSPVMHQVPPRNLSTCEPARTYSHSVRSNVRAAAVVVNGFLGLTAAAGGGQMAVSCACAPLPPTKEPLPSGPGAPAYLCHFYFGDTPGIAKEFGVASADLDTPDVHSTYGTISCPYQVPEGEMLVLSMTNRAPTMGSSDACGCIESSSSVSVYAFAAGSPIRGQVSAANAPWLKRAATRATLPQWDHKVQGA